MTTSCILSVAAVDGTVLGNLGLQTTPTPRVFTMGYLPQAGNPFGDGWTTGYGVQLGRDFVLCDPFGYRIGWMANFVLGLAQTSQRALLYTTSGSFWGTVTYTGLIEGTTAEMICRGLRLSRGLTIPRRVLAFLVEPSPTSEGGRMNAEG